jgi:hypothetical protein
VFFSFSMKIVIMFSENMYKFYKLSLSLSVPCFVNLLERWVKERRKKINFLCMWKKGHKRSKKNQAASAIMNIVAVVVRSKQFFSSLPSHSQSLATAEKKGISILTIQKLYQERLKEIFIHQYVKSTFIPPTQK